MAVPAPAKTAAVTLRMTIRFIGSPPFGETSGTCCTAQVGRQAVRRRPARVAMAESAKSFAKIRKCQSWSNEGMAFVRLAGGILWREGSEGLRVAVIHRPRQADWSLPKGRLDEGESWEETALREVEEETGCEARITSFARATVYLPRRFPRLVLYWHMALRREGRFEASKEVDELVWLAPADALARLDHESERRLLQRSTARAAAGPAPLLTRSPAADLAAAPAQILPRSPPPPARDHPG